MIAIAQVVEQLAAIWSESEPEPDQLDTLALSYVEADLEARRIGERVRHMAEQDAPDWRTKIDSLRSRAIDLLDSMIHEYGHQRTMSAIRRARSRKDPEYVHAHDGLFRPF